jgi:hypothetical protein
MELANKFGLSKVMKHGRPRFAKPQSQATIEFK